MTQVDDWKGLRDWALGEAFDTDEGYDPLTIDEHHITYKLEPALEAVEAIEATLGGFDLYELEAKTKFTALEDAFGTVDILARAGDTCAVLDYKFGDGIQVQCKGNDQLMFYAAAAMLDPKFKDFTEGVDKFFLAIIQPLQTHDDVDEYYTTWTVSRAQIEQWVEFVVRIMKDVESPDAPLKTGPHCRWCKAKHCCPEYTRKPAEMQATTPIGVMSPTEIGHWLKVADDAETWVKSIRAKAHKELERGVQIPGFKLVKKRATRRYIDEDAAEEALVDVLGDGAHKKSLLSPAQVEKALGKPRYREVVDSLVHKVSSGTTMAPDSDPREDVSGAMNQLGDSLRLALNAEAKPKGKRKK